MNASNHEILSTAPAQEARASDDDGPPVTFLDLLRWIGEGKRLIAGLTFAAAVASVALALVLPDVYTARATLLPPNVQQASGAGGAAALAALGALGGVAGGLAQRSPDELYVALLRSETVQRALDEKFKLRERLRVATYEELKLALPKKVRIAADRKTGVIAVEVDDEDPAFAAMLANAYGTELVRLLDRLAVTEAQQRRLFFEGQLKQTKENLIKAEDTLRSLQERSGVIVLEKQAEALLQGASVVRAQIAEREVQLRVLRTSATAQNPAVQRLEAEVAALRSELARMQSTDGNRQGSAVDVPVGRLPEAAIEYVRARRELRMQETLLDSMLRQYELAKLDEAKEGPLLQPVDRALPPDRKSKPKRTFIVLGSAAAAFVLASLFVIGRSYRRAAAEWDPRIEDAWSNTRRAWRLRSR